MMTLELDLHNLKKDEAVRLIQRTIVNNSKLDEIVAIHGYNNGTELKRLLQDPHNIHNKREEYTTDGWNDGVTLIVLRR